MDLVNVSGYKINTQKSLAFLYTVSEGSETEIKKMVPFIITTEIMKCLRIKLPMEAKYCT